MLLANGSDHLPIQPQLPEICARSARLPDRPLLGLSAAGRRIAHLRGRARRQPAPERPARRQLRAHVSQAGERARRAAAARRRDRGRAACTSGGDGASRTPTSGSPGATSCATIRTTRSAAARATRCTATCSSATSSSTARSRSSSGRRSASAALVNPLPVRRAPSRRRRRSSSSTASRAARGAARVVRSTRLNPASVGLRAVVEDEPDVGDLYTFCPGGPVPPGRAGRVSGRRARRRRSQIEHGSRVCGSRRSCASSSDASSSGRPS